MRDKLKRDRRLLRKLGVASQKLVSMLTDASVGDRGVLRIKALVFGAIFTFPSDPEGVSSFLFFTAAHLERRMFPGIPAHQKILKMESSSN